MQIGSNWLNVAQSLKQAHARVLYGYIVYTDGRGAVINTDRQTRQSTAARHVSTIDLPQHGTICVAQLTLMKFIVYVMTKW